MEKRIVAIIRWLERCSKECRAGTLESALMDVECARADIDRLRDEVWAKLERQYTAKVRTRRFFAFAQALFLGLCVILAAPTPILFQEAPATALVISENLSVIEPSPIIFREAAAVTPSINEVRRDLTPNPPPQRRAEPQNRLPAEDRAENRGAPAPEQLQQREEEHISYDRIIALVQTGEKALKNTAPAIIVEK